MRVEDGTSSQKFSLFQAIKSIFAPQGCDRITVMDLNESQDLEVMNEDIFLRYVVISDPPMTHQMTKIGKSEFFPFLNALNGVQPKSQSYIYCSPELD